jgi:hypothetical protein
MQTLGLGFTWEELSPGQRFFMLNRTITETDLVLFTGVTRCGRHFHRPPSLPRRRGQGSCLTSLVKGCFAKA